MLNSQISLNSVQKAEALSFSLGKPFAKSGRQQAGRESAFQASVAADANWARVDEVLLAVRPEQQLNLAIH